MAFRSRFKSTASLSLALAGLLILARPSVALSADLLDFKLNPKQTTPVYHLASEPTPTTQADSKPIDLPAFKLFERDDITGFERFVNFGEVYLFQWVVYYVSQPQEIADHGSFQNYITNPFHPEFDKDSFDWNIYRHTFVGQYYYLWYRSHGYTSKAAFAWAFASSLAFETTIEVVTERPSFQDIYQTPVYGSILGIGVEHLSNYLMSTHVWPAELLATLLNPFTLLPQSQYRFAAMPIITKDSAQAVVKWEF